MCAAENFVYFSLNLEKGYNINKSEFLVLKDFLKKKPFKVIESDKNVGPVDKLDSDFLNIKVFREILMLVLLNNVFMFNNMFYIQTKGIAMGCKCGPSVANIYVYHYEKLFLNIHRPLCYFRFIDDIFIITSIFFDINLLINSFPNLKLNVISEAITNFLDLNIYVDKITNSLIFSLYLKPTLSLI